MSCSTSCSGSGDTPGEGRLGRKDAGDRFGDSVEQDACPPVTRVMSSIPRNIRWKDILRIIKQQGGAQDVPYLARWADVLGVRDLLERALVVAGLKQP